MATLVPQLFAKADKNTDEEEQLLQLFWKRAELKQEFEKLRTQSFILTEKLQEQEAINLRVQQKLEQLESNLGDPEYAGTVFAYYQLRSVWNHCHSRLASLANDLEHAQYDKGLRQHLAGFKRQLHESLVDVNEQLRETTAKSGELSAKIRAMREMRSSRRGIWNFFRRRRMTTEINAYRDERRVLTLEINTLTEVVHERISQEPPDYSGLDLLARRSINLGVIAYAQELYLYFADRDLARHMLDSSLRQLKDVSYGSKRDCRGVSKYLEDRMSLLTMDSKLQPRVQLRAQHLSSLLHYNQEHDVVPVAGDLNAIVLFKSDGQPKGEEAVNVLADNYWDVYSVLMT
jgi:hypothetical protein